MQDRQASLETNVGLLGVMMLLGFEGSLGGKSTGWYDIYVLSAGVSSGGTLGGGGSVAARLGISSDEA